MGYFSLKPNASKRDWMSEYSSKWGSSSFWLGDDTKWSSSKLVNSGNSTSDLVKKAAAKRSVSNFVNIVTKKSIPVKFMGEGGTSATDGKSVVISANIDKPEDFDIAVGLALHEGSHIRLSSYDILKNLSSYISRGFGRELMDYQNKASNLGIDLAGLVKNMLNWVEDRRIDQYIYDEAPGYQGYYHAMYNKYFNSDMINTALLSTSFRDETVESYMMRIVNLHADATDLNALKGLREISEIVDLPTISRLKDTNACFDIAVKIVKIILDNSISNKSHRQDQKQNMPKQKGNQQGEQGTPSNEAVDKSESGEDSESQESESNSDDSKESKDSKGKGEKSEEESNEDSEAEAGDGEKSEPKEPKEKSDNKSNSQSNSQEDGEEETEEVDPISASEFRQALEDLVKQISFLDGNVDKEAITSEEVEALKNILESKTELKIVGEEFGNGEVQCVIVNNLTEALLNDKNFPLSSHYKSYDSEVNEGIKMGTLLGKKLQTRSESRETIFNRQATGKVDKRMVSSFGYGYDNAFYTKEVDKYNKANLHISVDASGSMSGEKWRKTLVNIVALAKAVDMIPNLEIQISFRTTTDHGYNPYVVIAYDSRVDKFTKVKSMFPKIGPDNTTPEGLCFEGMLKHLVPSATDMDSYFVNLSDGAPYFSTRCGKNYSGSNAAKHTNRMVKKIQDLGINVLSYYVEEGHEYEAEQTFRECYGKAASFIDVRNIQQVSVTLNKLFMTKK
jgi:hypothetical protein